ncbi:MAG: hypothetical protein CVV05_20360 [Gammaproteobacteria bacterium HGW-Gammaproteobacteria-1]|nr:MAG: hypothetical protein CVV05_20360 [Gammaproteobacteria bacterium HGW-Gammaproteobacteria-1]
MHDLAVERIGARNRGHDAHASGVLVADQDQGAILHAKLGGAAIGFCFRVDTQYQFHQPGQCHVAG